MGKASSKVDKKVTDPEVLVAEMPAASGLIGVLTLNSEKTLNALSINMVRIISDALSAWQDNAEIAAIVIQGQGSKAFCAGGDVQALYHSATHQEDGACVDAEQFFIEEYQLDYMIHTYDKPIVCIGHGIVMGGGLGLLAGASHRIVCESTKLAMPEITIGLFPDVGGTLFLNQVPYNLGYFLALTGAMINASDTLFCRLADVIVAQADIDKVLEALYKLDLSDNPEANHQLVSESINTFASPKSLVKPSLLQQNIRVLENAFQHNSLCQIVNSVKEFDDSNEFLCRAKKNMLAGSPLSLVMIYEQLKRHRHSDLQSIFKSELILATNLVRHPDFAEGVRALLIDKDKSPQWTYEHYSHIPSSVIEALFRPWSENPLTTLLT